MVKGWGCHRGALCGFLALGGDVLVLTLVAGLGERVPRSAGATARLSGLPLAVE
jgi:hypothetical protein